MTEPKYKTGDIVQLKSGGPNMTVENVNDTAYGGLPVDAVTYGCQWFSGKKLEFGTFPEDSLIVPETKK